MLRIAALVVTTSAVVAGGGYLWVRQRGRRLARALRSAPGSWPVQTTDTGQGPLYFRSYHLDIRNPKASALDVMQKVQADLDSFCPFEVARFEKTHGGGGTLSPGDEFYIHIRAPWDGPVRVAEVGPHHFRLVTLAGHMEAGAIRFRVLERPGGILRFEIASCARSSGALMDAAYDLLRVARRGQQRMWSRFCEKVCDAAGGEVVGSVQVHTFRAPYGEPLSPGDSDEPSAYQAILGDIAARALNFEPPEDDTPLEGWHQDDVYVDLIAEPPGPPLKGGSWSHAREFVKAYRFPDPGLIQGHFDPDAPLEGRSMLLRGRFLGLVFPFGVRISRAFEETRDTPKGPLRVWGYSYRTLEHHFERGQITFMVGKYMDSGRVIFRIQSYSQRAHIPNPLFRVGFRMFGRWLQARFTRTALVRTRDYVEERLVREACLEGDGAAAKLLLRDTLSEAEAGEEPQEWSTAPEGGELSR
ncbi:MAG: DUF1990 family protein [Gemmatimonadota bacterium]